MENSVEGELDSKEVPVFNSNARVEEGSWYLMKRLQCYVG